MTLPVRRVPTQVPAWTPMREFENLFQELGRLVQSAFTEPEGVAWVPPTDVTETDDAYEIEIELPGVKREDIDIEVNRGDRQRTGRPRRDQSRGEGRCTAPPHPPPRRLRVPHDAAQRTGAGPSRGEPVRRRADRTRAQEPAKQAAEGGNQPAIAGGGDARWCGTGVGERGGAAGGVAVPDPGAVGSPDPAVPADAHATGPELSLPVDRGVAVLGQPGRAYCAPATGNSGGGRLPGAPVALDRRRDLAARPAAAGRRGRAFPAATHRCPEQSAGSAGLDPGGHRAPPDRRGRDGPRARHDAHHIHAVAHARRFAVRFRRCRWHHRRSGRANNAH